MAPAPPPERDPATLESLVMGYRLSHALAAAAELGLAELLREAPRTPLDIAAAEGWNPDRVHRLLRYLASEGIFTAAADGSFGLNPISRRLLPGEPGSALAMIRGWYGLPLAMASYGALAAEVRTGETAFHHVYGTDFHDYLAAHPVDAAAYNEAMESTEEGFAEAVMSGNLGRFRSILDVGGGEGSLLRLLRAHAPGARLALLELPHVARGARERLAAAPGGEGIEVMEGDMFEAVVPGFDAYAMSTVLRCFDDPDCVRLLDNCRSAMNPGGRVMALEQVLDDGPAPPGARTDIVAMVLYGGRDRTRTDWRSLAERARMEVVGFTHVDGPFHWVEMAAAV